MRTEAECLAEADQMSRLASGCPQGIDRDNYALMASNWTRLAVAVAAEAARISRERLTTGK